MLGSMAQAVLAHPRWRWYKLCKKQLYPGICPGGKQRQTPRQGQQKRRQQEKGAAETTQSKAEADASKAEGIKPARCSQGRRQRKLARERREAELECLAPPGERQERRQRQGRKQRTRKGQRNQKWQRRRQVRRQLWTAGWKTLRHSEAEAVKRRFAYLVADARPGDLL